MLGIVVLLCSILGGSSIGVVSNYIPIECPFAKNAWRAGIICVYFFIPFLYEIYSISKKKTTKIENVYTFGKYLFFLATLVMQALWVFGLMQASQKTVQSHAYLLNNLHGIYIVLINVVVGKEVLSLEYQGVVFSILGVFLSLADSSAHRSSTQFNHVSPHE